MPKPNIGDDITVLQGDIDIDSTIISIYQLNCLKSDSMLGILCQAGSTQTVVKKKRTLGVPQPVLPAQRRAGSVFQPEFRGGREDHSMVTGERFRIQLAWFWLQGLSAVWPWAHSLTSLNLSFLIYKVGNIIPASKEDLKDAMVSGTQEAQQSALRRFSENQP